jgi:hypothetical protein
VLAQTPLFVARSLTSQLHSHDQPAALFPSSGETKVRRKKVDCRGKQSFQQKTKHSISAALAEACIRWMLRAGQLRAK